MRPSITSGHLTQTNLNSAKLFSVHNTQRFSRCVSLSLSQPIEACIYDTQSSRNGLRAHDLRLWMRNTITVCDGIGHCADREAKSRGTEYVLMLVACQLSTWVYISLICFHAKSTYAHQQIHLFHSLTHT